MGKNHWEIPDQATNKKLWEEVVGELKKALPLAIAPTRISATLGLVNIRFNANCCIRWRSVAVDGYSSRQLIVVDGEGIVLNLYDSGDTLNREALDLIMFRAGPVSARQGILQRRDERRSAERDRSEEVIKGHLDRALIRLWCVHHLRMTTVVIPADIACVFKHDSELYKFARDYTGLQIKLELIMDTHRGSDALFYVITLYRFKAL